MRPILFASTVLILAGCGAELTGPSPERYRLPRVITYCNPAGETVVCSATLVDVPAFRDTRDVTQTGEWSVIPADVGTFALPGVLAPKTAGEAEIRVRSEGFQNEGSRFLIGPGRPARWLHFFSAWVRETDNVTGIGGALVEMLDGYQSGQKCVTNSGAGTCSIDRVLTGEAFAVRISKAGYRTLTTSYRVDPPAGPAGNSPFLVVLLEKAG